jgi:predicted phage tail protein
MRKMVTIEYSEYLKYSETIDQLRTQIQNNLTELNSLKKEIAFLKDQGENILVIIKDNNKPDVHEYKSDEKNIITQLVEENYRVRERYDELSRKIDNVENQKAMIIIKYNEMETQYKNEITKLEEYLDFLENRTLLSRLKNEKKNINRNFTTINSILEIAEKSTETYSDDEINKIEESVRHIKKPRGWHLKEEFIDSEGNVYHKGKIQPQLKKFM